MSSPPLSSQQKKTTMSNNIPLPSTYVSRTESECQLAIDLATAEKRDERMFYRLINGIQDRHRQMKKKTELSTRSSPRTTRHAEQQQQHEHMVVDHRIDCAYPTLALANIVETHHTEISTHGVSTTPRHHHHHHHHHHHQVQDNNNNNNYDDDESPFSSILPTTTGKNVSDSTLSDNDWSITGYEDELDVSDRVERRRDKEEEDNDNDEEMFILDL